jgi:lysozyme family protein
MSIEQETDDLQRMTEGQLRRFQDRANTIEQVRAAGALLEEINRRRLAEAVREFRQGTAVFIDLTEKLEALIATIKVDPPAGALATFNGLLDSATRLHAAIRDPERFAHAIEEGEDHLILLPLRDEAETPPPAAPARVAINPSVAPPTVDGLLPPRNSKTYAELKDEYVRLFEAAEVRPQWAGDLAFYMKQARKFRPRYEKVANGLGIPWAFIACIHALESSFDFNTHLYNGDPLSAKTVHVPKNKPDAPPANGERYDWEESAKAAMRDKGFASATDWSLPRLLYRLEAYNGFGYRSRHVATPYLWSFSTVYDKGRFVADHRFDPDAGTRQAGAAVILKQLAREGDIPQLVA